MYIHYRKKQIQTFLDSGALWHIFASANKLLQSADNVSEGDDMQPTACVFKTCVLNGPIRTVQRVAGFFYNRFNVRKYLSTKVLHLID